MTEGASGPRVPSSEPAVGPTARATEPASARESPVLYAVRAALAQTGRVLIARNNVGVDTTRGVRYGLGTGSPDLVGVLRPSGRFVAFEVKSSRGRCLREQRLWHDAYRQAGAFVAIVRSADEALSALDRAERGECQ